MLPKDIYKLTKTTINFKVISENNEFSIYIVTIMFLKSGGGGVTRYRRPLFLCIFEPLHAIPPPVIHLS